MGGLCLPKILAIFAQNTRGFIAVRRKCEVCNEWDNGQWNAFELMEEKPDVILCKIKEIVHLSILVTSLSFH